MTSTLDHASQAQILEIDVWLQSATCKEGFAITRRIVHDTIAASLVQGFCDDCLATYCIRSSVGLAGIVATASPVVAF